MIRSLNNFGSFLHRQATNVERFYAGTAGSFVQAQTLAERETGVTFAIPTRHHAVDADLDHAIIANLIDNSSSSRRISGSILDRLEFIRLSFSSC